MRAALLFVVVATVAEAKSPVAKPYSGSVLSRKIDLDSAGVVARFKTGTTRTEVQPALESVLKGMGGGAPTVGFVRTEKGPLVAVFPGEEMRLEQLLVVASAVSQVPGVEAAWAWLHPGNEDLALEATWKFQRGVRVGDDQFEWRDEPTYTKWLRRSATADEWQKKKWGKFPIALLARELGLPGRDALERPRALLELATSKAPNDVGENLVHAFLFWPDGMLLEVRQEAERNKVSLSRVVEDAIRAVHAMNKLGEEPAEKDKAPYDGQTRSKELEVFLTRESYSRVEEKNDKEFSTSMADVWRLAHPYGKKK